MLTDDWSKRSAVAQLTNELTSPSSGTSDWLVIAAMQQQKSGDGERSSKLDRKRLGPLCNKDS
jgi:hypothetical protein